jgi:uncharacterized protein YbaA (DUF1428 family)
MAYVDGFVVPVPKANKEAYRALAAKAAPIFKEYGALSVVECWADDVPKGQVTDFYMAVKCTDEETAVFSWITWPDKATRDAGQEKVMNDPRFGIEETRAIFDSKRMIYGGFEILVEL